MSIPSFNLGNLQLKLPIIQGGMGIGVSLSKLASAVANEGGIGVLSAAQIGYREKDFKTDNNGANLRALISEIKETRRLSPTGVIGVNFLASTRNYAEMVKAAVNEKIDVIISGAGIPKNLPELVEGSETKIAPIVSSRKAAVTILKLWKRKYDRLADMIIVEGPDAGGHLGFKKSDLLEGNIPPFKDIVKEIVEGVKEFEEKYNQKIPVIAAGGIFSGKDIREFLDLGATGVQMATRFVATDECDAHENFQQAYVDCGKDDIEIIDSPVGLPGRALNNKFVERLKAKSLEIKSCYRCLRGCDPKTAPFCITEALVKSVTGDVENGLVFVGSNGYRLKEIKPIKEVFKDIIREYEESAK
jgi:NAD(P)H-dependent flavin oxidoreductase YrpB (nitropropane dioxygenase family)